MIDIDDLSEKELIDLNNRIVARVKFLRDMRAHASMLEFSLGERVTFQPDGHPPLFGFVAKYNRKSVTVVTERGQHWTVAPNFLRKVKRVELPAPASGSGVVPIGKRQARDQPGQGRHSSHPRSGKVFYLASAPTFGATLVMKSTR